MIGEDRLSPEQRAVIPAKLVAAEAALALMERELATRDWMVASGFSLADLCLYAYTHVAGEGGFDLVPYPALRAWLARVAAQPGHVPIDA